MIGDILTVWDKGGGRVRCESGQQRELARAVDLYLDDDGFAPGAGKDRRIMLITLGGGVYSILASHISSWMVTTAETRRETVRIDLELEAEEAASKEACASVSDESESQPGVRTSGM
jgi:hypothetical protein